MNKFQFINQKENIVQKLVTIGKDGKKLSI